MSAFRTDIHVRPFLIGFPAAGLVLGFILRATGRDQWSDLAWATATLA